MKLKIITALTLTILGTNVALAQTTITNSSTTEANVEVKLFTRKLFDRTEYALGIKNNEFKNIQNDKLSNEVTNLTSSQKNLITSTLKNLKANSSSNLIKSTDPQIIKLQSQKKLQMKYKEDSMYFKNYKIGSHSIGFAATLSDNSIVLLGDFKENSGESKMFGMILSNNKGKNYLNSITAGATSIIIAYPPEQNKNPVVISNPVKGFSTKDLDKLGASLLVPNDWFYRYEENNGTQAYFISEQEIKNDTDIFETGFSMNVNYQYLVPGGDAVKYLDVHLNKIKAVAKIESSTSGENENYIYKQIIGTFDDNGYKYKMAVRVIANIKTNTIYVLSFESTPKKWNTNWVTKGKTMFDYLSISR